jgi:hypothetical protein
MNNLDFTIRMEEEKKIEKYKQFVFENKLNTNLGTVTFDIPPRYPQKNEFHFESIENIFL